MFGNARIVRRRDDRIQSLLENARTDDEVGDFAFLANLPVDELLDVGMIGVEHDHLCRAAGRAAGFDGAGGAIENFEKRHEAARRAAAGEFLAGRAKLREVCAAAGAAFKDARFPDDAVKDAALIDQIVLNSKDVTRRNLRLSVGIA